MKRTSKSALRLIPVLAGSLTLIGCVSQNQLDTLQMRVTQQEQQIQALNSQLSGVQPAQADTWAQVQSLRQEMGAVRGQIDDFNNATAPVGGLTGLAQRIARHEAALRAIGMQFDMNLNLDAPVEPVVPGGAPSTPGMPGGDMTGGPVGQPGTAIPGVAGAAQQPGMAQTGAQQPQPTPQTAQQLNKDMATVLYDTGMKSFNARNYKQAFNAFRDFTETYPKHRLVSNAWFWRGESEYQLGNYPAGALAYEEVISKYPGSGKAAAAYLKQGMCFIKTGKKDAARLRLEELIKKYPKSAEATRAKQVIKDMK